MVRRLLPPLLLPLLAACASAPPPESPAVPVTVKVPVYTPVFCKPPALAHPVLPIAALTAGSPAADTMRCYAASIVILEGAVKDREAIIAGCAAPAAPLAPRAVNISDAAPSPVANSQFDTHTAPAAPKPSKNGLTNRLLGVARALARGSSMTIRNLIGH